MVSFTKKNWSNLLTNLRSRAFPHEANVEPQIRIVLRQLHSLTLREMAVSFPWPTREMAGAEVLPIRSMQPEEKHKWLQQLWGMLTVEKNKDAARRGRSTGSSASNARFEAPRPNTARSKSPLASTSRNQSPQPPAFVVNTPPAVQLETLSLDSVADPSHPRSLSPALSPGSLRRSNATTSGTAPDRMRRLSKTQNLVVPGEVARYQLSEGDEGLSSGDEWRYHSRPRSPSLAISPTRGGDVGLTRLLSVKRPNDSVLSDAMALALFRVDED